MNRIFDQMMSKYDISTKDQKLNALHEVMQEVTLAALYRAQFFDYAAFYGGTCLRIFHNLPRFSEDMDFSLLQSDDLFTLEPYFDAIESEFHAYGREIEIVRKNKKVESSVESAFLKDNTDIYNIRFKTEKTVKIKIEVDKQPPQGFTTEHNLLMLPFSFMVRCFDISCLYAGKMHALLFRNWRGRIKGRDWYDFEWYVRNGHQLHFDHLRQRALQKGYEGAEEFTPEVFSQLLKEKIASTDISQVIKDVRPFIQNAGELNIWSTDYFLRLADMIQYKSEG